MKRSYLSYFYAVTVLLVCGALTYGTFTLMWLATGESAMNEPARVVCTSPGTCFITAHVHAQIRVFKSGTELDLGYERGNLERNHIHSQENILHWHGLIPVQNGEHRSPTFHELAQYDDFQLRHILPDLNIVNNGTVRYVRNGKKAEKTDAWQVDDTIEVYIDE